MDAEIGARIQEARYRKGLTQAQVAQAIDLDRAAISRIESGQRAITASELVLAARTLEVDVKWLLEAKSEPQTPIVRARMLTRAGPVQPDDEPQLQWFADVFACLQGVRSIVRPRLNERVLRLPPGQAGELAARRVRALLGLESDEPVVGLSALLREIGIEVIAGRLPSRSKLAGCLLATPSHGAAFINSNHVYTRQRFTLAHEVAHYLFDTELDGHACDAGGVRRGPRSTVEYRADVFASAFLVPRAGLERLRTENRISVVSIEGAKSLYRVSQAALLARLRALTIVSETEKRVLQRVLPREGGLKPVPPFRVMGETAASEIRQVSPNPGMLKDCMVVQDSEVVS